MHPLDIFFVIGIHMSRTSIISALTIYPSSIEIISFPKCYQSLASIMLKPDKFKLPSAKIVQRKDIFGDLPRFSWKDLSEFKVIGHGSFGLVEYAIYKPKEGETRNVVLKQPLHLSEYEKEFAKEAKLLNSVRGHRNIVEFLGVCVRPNIALMQEYLEFSFAPFADPFAEDKVVNSLEAFLSYVETSYNFEGFEHVIQTIALDIVKGLAVLHSKNIVHRDLKPANILVSNQHYLHLEREEIQKLWQDGGIAPIICKLTDFGESRSLLIQTKSLLSSKVNELDRGSPAFMAPELLVLEKRPAVANIHDLKAADMWALGMIMFVLVNPDSKFPYRLEVERERKSNPMIDPKDMLIKLQREEKYPESSGNYAKLQALYWDTPLQIYNMCVSFNSEDRVRSIEPVSDLCKKELVRVECVVKNMPVSQSSALERANRKAAERIQASMSKTECQQDYIGMIRADGTNCCVFLCLKICDILVRNIPDDNDATSLAEKICSISTNIVNSYPLEINEHRDWEKIYEVITAYTLMNGHNHIGTYEITEELPYLDGYFSKNGRTNLLHKLREVSSANETFLSIYTCEPYSITIGSIRNRLFLVDTHPVVEECQGNQNGQVRVYEDNSDRTCQAICKWIWGRLVTSGVRFEVGQSLALLKQSKSFTIIEARLEDRGAETQYYHQENIDVIDLTLDNDTVSITYLSSPPK